MMLHVLKGGAGFEQAIAFVACFGDMSTRTEGRIAAQNGSFVWFAKKVIIKSFFLFTRCVVASITRFTNTAGASDYRFGRGDRDRALRCCFAL
ncbi:hypothetical protein CRD36_08690 [Paremcibacter congregatus]|uniref:Uncharacterized protein n=2 Tax=Paremcibacter congregatus TaxID=2043170 RepID=A0A2G4YR60_9PROT|nr:hypothetical protein CRD36_08690 [Paremcibacter congregatus]